MSDTRDHTRCREWSREGSKKHVYPKRVESLREIIRRDDPDAANFTYIIEVEAQDNSHLLPAPVTPNEEWDTNKIKASLVLIFEGEEHRENRLHHYGNRYC